MRQHVVYVGCLLRKLPLVLKPRQTARQGRAHPYAITCVGTWTGNCAIPSHCFKPLSHESRQSGRRPLPPAH